MKITLTALVLAGCAADAVDVGGELICVDCGATRLRLATHTSDGLTVTGSTSIAHLAVIHELAVTTSLDASRGYSETLDETIAKTGNDSLSASFRVDRSSIFDGASSYTQANTTAVSIASWRFGVAPGGGLDSVCSRHSGSDTVGYVTFDGGCE